MLGYDAVEDRPHRRKNPGITQSEDRELTAHQRKKLISGTRDIRRNFEIAAWAVRKHLDYVSSFSFRSKSGNPEWDRKVQEYIKERSKPQNCDAAGKKSLRKVIRLAEALRTVDGDVGLLKLADGRAQFIEGDRIKNPPDQSDLVSNDRWTHGVKTNKAGRALAYGIYRRNGQRLEFERTIASSRMYLHGYFDRADQVRGISILATALNRMADTYDAMRHSLAKAKVLQLLGLVVQRKTNSEDEDDCELEEEAEDGEPKPSFKLDLDNGPFTMEIDVDDKASLLQTNHPNNEFQTFMQSCISIALKAIDIPYFFFDESSLNFFGGKVALSNYLISCNDKREDNIDLLNWWTRWQIGMAVATGELNPAEFGLSWEDIDGAWRWIPRGIPWWDKGKEISGDILSVHSGFEDWSSIIEARTGQQFEDVIDRIAEEQQYIKGKGVVIAGPKDLLNFAAMAAQTQGGDDAGN